MIKNTVKPRQVNYNKRNSKIQIYFKSDKEIEAMLSRYGDKLNKKRSIRFA